MKHILIVGAGPVGLFLAIQIHKLSPEYKIDIWEKRDNYTRELIVIMNNNNLQRLPKKIHNELFGKNGPGCYVKPPPLDQANRCYVTKGTRPFGSIIISELEKILKKYVLELHNITIINQEASNVNLSNAIGKYDHIVGVDGKQSVVRKFMGGTTTDYLSGYGFVMVFKSPKPALVRPDKAIVGIEARATSAAPQHRFRAFRSRGLNYYVAIQLQKNEYNKIGTAKTLADVSPSLQIIGKEAIAFYGMTPPLPVDIKLSHFPIQISVSDFISKKIKKTRITIIGDAFLGVNFFSGKGLNFGMDEAVTLAEVISNENSIIELRREMKGFAKERISAINTLNIPQENNVLMQECQQLSKKERLQIGKQMGVDVKMLNSKNQCLILNRSTDLLDIITPTPSKSKHKSKSKSKSKSRKCKYGLLKRPVKLPSGRKRYCKKSPKSRRKN